MVYEKVVKMLAETVECNPSELGMNTVFEELGMDSLDITELVMNLENEFSVEIEVNESIKTVADLVVTIEGLLK
jgi:acyl carrier protein